MKVIRIIGGVVFWCMGLAGSSLAIVVLMRALSADPLLIYFVTAAYSGFAILLFLAASREITRHAGRTGW